MEVLSNKEKGLEEKGKAVPNHVLSAALLEFEKDNEQFIVNHQYDGWNTWQLIKKHLYYVLKNKGHATKDHTSSRNGFLQVIGSSISYIAKIFAFSISRRNALLVFTNTNYKLDVNEKGRAEDIFVDGFLSHHYKGKYIYIEASKSGFYKQNAFIKRDLDDSGKYFFCKIIEQFVGQGRIRSAANSFADEMNRYFRKHGYNLTISSASISQALTRFHSEYVFFSWVLRLLQPKALFFVDGIPAAAMAVANRRSIPVYDFQHGFISKDKPDYILSSYLKGIRSQMVLPNYILVFGKFFKDIILKNNSWPADSIRVLGNQRVDKLRSKPGLTIRVNFGAEEKARLLFATQPSTYKHCKKFLEQLVPLLPAGVIITIKCHTREPKENNDWYQALAAAHPDKIHFVAAEQNLVSLMARHHLLASYHSTAIFEALALGVPVITIGTSEYPLGTNSLVDIPIGDVLKSAVTPEEFVNLLHRYQADPAFRNKWLESCAERSGYFYSYDYKENLEVLNQHLSTIS